MVQFCTRCLDDFLVSQQCGHLLLMGLFFRLRHCNSSEVDETRWVFHRPSPVNAKGNLKSDSANDVYDICKSQRLARAWNANQNDFNPTMYTNMIFYE